MTERNGGSMDDLISRKAAIDVIDKIFPVDPMRNDYTQGITCGAALATEYIKQLPSAQPEPCEDAVSREEAKWVVFCNRDHVEDQANAIDALPPVTPKAEQPDMSGYSDKLWKAAYERGKAEAQAEIVRCKDCKHRTSYWGNCRLLEEKYHQSVLVDGDSFCSMAERRTDE